MVDAEYAQALKWLRLLGFRLLEPEPFGPDGELFQFAIKSRSDHAIETGEGSTEGGVEPGEQGEAEEKEGRVGERGEGSIRLWTPTQERLEAAG